MNLFWRHKPSAPPPSPLPSNATDALVETLQHVQESMNSLSSVPGHLQTMQAALNDLTAVVGSLCQRVEGLEGQITLAPPPAVTWKRPSWIPVKLMSLVIVGLRPLFVFVVIFPMLVGTFATVPSPTSHQSLSLADVIEVVFFLVFLFVVLPLFYLRRFYQNVVYSVIFCIFLLFTNYYKNQYSSNAPLLGLAGLVVGSIWSTDDFQTDSFSKKKCIALGVMTLLLPPIMVFPMINPHWSLKTFVLLVAVSYVGMVIGAFVSPALLLSTGILKYIKAMVQPLVALAVSYVCFVIVFAGWYLADYGIEGQGGWATVPNVPLNNDDAIRHLWDFIYFSFMTIVPLGLGYSPIRPKAPWSSTIVTAEAIIGSAFSLVAVAAIVAYLSPLFAALAATTKIEAARKDKAIKTP